MNLQETYMDFSPIESDILNIKIGRVATDHLDISALSADIIKNEYDLCRLKISAEIENTVLQLDNLGFPAHFSASIRRYSTLVSKLEERAFMHPDIIYEKFDGSQNLLLKDMLIDVWGTYPIGYYRTPYLNHIMPKNKEILCVYEYYKKYNLQRDYPKSTIMFMKHGDNYVGFFALNIIEDRLESHIGGILSPYREGGYFFDMQEYIRRFCIANELKYFCFGARNENSRVQMIFEKFGYKAAQTENVFHIPSFLSFSQRPVLKKELSVKTNSQSINYSLLLNCFEDDSIHNLLPDYYRQSFLVGSLAGIVPGLYQISIGVPIITSNNILSVLKVYNKDGAMVSYGHLDRRIQ